jgi:hypothetical protein
VIAIPSKSNVWDFVSIVLTGIDGKRPPRDIEVYCGEREPSWRLEIDRCGLGIPRATIPMMLFRPISEPRRVAR